MNNEVLKSKAIKSVSIKLIEKILTLGLQLVISIILARLLSPDDYGLIALINIFIVFSNVFVEFGFGVGLVQKKDINSIDVNTVFWSSLGIGILLYAVLFLISPFIALFYESDLLSSVLRVYGITIIIGSVTSINNSIVSRMLEYKKQFFSSLISTIISGIFGVYLAFSGYGVWALVAQQITQKLIYLVVIWLYTRYVPKFEFSFDSFHEILGFTWKIVLAKMVSALFNEIRSLIIGKKYDNEQLGYYNKGNQFPSMIATATDYSLQSVMFSVYSKRQDSVDELKAMVKKTIKLSSFLLFPMMFGMIAVAEPLVSCILTDKWMPAVQFMRIACLSYVLQPMVTANLQAINAMGKSDVTLRCEIIKRVIAVVLIAFSLFFNIYAIAWTMVAVAVVGMIQSFALNEKYLNYSLKDQIFDLLPALTISMLMCLVVYLLQYLPINYWLVLLIQIIVGMFIYFVLSWIFKLDSFIYSANAIKNFFNKNKKASY